MKRLNRKHGAILLVAALVVLLFSSVPLYAADVSSGSDDESSPEESASEVAGVPSVAQVVLSDYLLEKAEEDFTYNLNITLANEGNAGAFNILLTFQDDERSLLPAYGNSNQVYVGALGAKQDTKIVIPLVANGSVDSFFLAFTIDYLNPKQASHNAFYIGSFTGRPMDAVHILKLEAQGAADSTGKTLVRVSVMNRSSQSLVNATLLVFDPQSGSTQRVDLGTLEAGSTIEEDCTLLLASDRTRQIRASLSYDDEEGVTHTSAESLFTLYSTQEGDAGYRDGETAPLGDIAPYILEILIHLILIAVVLIMLFVIWRRRKRGAPPAAGVRRKKVGDKR